MFLQDLFSLFFPSSGQYTTEVQGKCSTITPERQRQRGRGGRRRGIEGGKEKYQSKFQNIPFSLEIYQCSSARAADNIGMHKHAHANTQSQKARKMTEMILQSYCSNQDTCSWKTTTLTNLLLLGFYIFSIFIWLLVAFSALTIAEILLLRKKKKDLPCSASGRDEKHRACCRDQAQHGTQISCGTEENCPTHSSKQSRQVFSRLEFFTRSQIFKVHYISFFGRYISSS